MKPFKSFSHAEAEIYDAAELLLHSNSCLLPTSKLSAPTLEELKKLLSKIGESEAVCVREWLPYREGCSNA